MTPESFWSALASGRCRGFSEAGASSLNSGTRLFVLCVNCLGRVTLGTALRAVFCPQPPLHTSSKLDFTGSADEELLGSGACSQVLWWKSGKTRELSTS